MTVFMILMAFKAVSQPGYNSDNPDSPALKDTATQDLPETPTPEAQPPQRGHWMAVIPAGNPTAPPRGEDPHYQLNPDYEIIPREEVIIIFQVARFMNYEMMIENARKLKLKPEDRETLVQELLAPNMEQHFITELLAQRQKDKQEFNQFLQEKTELLRELERGVDRDKFQQFITLPVSMNTFIDYFLLDELSMRRVDIDVDDKGFSLWQALAQALGDPSRSRSLLENVFRQFNIPMKKFHSTAELEEYSGSFDLLPYIAAYIQRPIITLKRYRAQTGGVYGVLYEYDAAKYLVHARPLLNEELTRTIMSLHSANPVILYNSQIITDQEVMPPKAIEVIPSGDSVKPQWFSGQHAPLNPEENVLKWGFGMDKECDGNW